MKRSQVIAAACLAVLLSTTSFAGDRVVAKYNGHDVLKSEVVARFKAASGGELPEGKKDLDDYAADMKQNLIGLYLREKALSLASENAKLANDAEYKKQLDNFNKQFKMRSYMDQYVKQRLTPSMVRDAYNKYVAELKSSDDLKISHILLPTEAEANKVSAELVSKKITFEEAAKKYSVDQASKAKGGEIGFIQAGQTVPEFEKAAYGLSNGSISPPVKTNFGWHIIKRIESKKKQIPSFDEVKPNLEQSVKIGLLETHVAELMQNAKVEIFTAK